MAFQNRVQKLAWAVLLCAASASSLHASYIWNTNIGTLIPATTFDSSSYPGVVQQSLSFTLPFEGTNYNSVYISEAGFVWLGGYNAAENTSVTSASNATTLFNQGAPRIAAGWYDLDPDDAAALSSSDGIYFYSNSSEAVITWSNVPSDSSTTDPAEFQMQLFSSGEIIFSYQLLDTNSLGSDPALMMGLTSGGGSSAVSVDLTSLLANQSMATEAANFYDYIQPPFTSIVDESITFSPNANGTWAVDATPEPATLIPSAAALLLLGTFFQRKRAGKY